MRISTAQFYEASAANYQRNYANVIATNEEVSSQVKLNTAADDPVGAARSLQLTQKNALLSQYKTNITTINQNATQAETALQGIQNSLQRAQELILDSSSGAKTDLDRQANAQELSQIQQTVLGLMNSQNANGDYIFSGSKAKTPPYALNPDGSYSYKGDQTAIKLSVGDGISLASNSTGWDAFEQAVNTTPTAATWAGSGTDDGKAVLSGGVVTNAAAYQASFAQGQPYTITFVSSTQLKIFDSSTPPKDVTNEASRGGAVNPSGPSNQTISFRGLEINLNINLTDADRANQATQDLALAGDATATPPVAPHAFTLGLSPSNVSTTRSAGNPSTTVISKVAVTDQTAYNNSFPAGGGAVLIFNSPPPPAAATDPSTSFSLYAAPYTAGDTPVGGGNITGTPPTATAAGVTFTLAGTPQGTDQFAVQANTTQTQNVLNTLGSVIKVLNTPVDGNPVATQKLQASMISALGNIKSAIDQTGSTMSAGGARQNAASDQETTNDSLTSNNSLEQAGIVNADPVESIARLTLQQTMLTASQLVFTRMSSLDLFSKL